MHMDSCFYFILHLFAVSFRHFNNNFNSKLQSSIRGATSHTILTGIRLWSIGLNPKPGLKYLKPTPHFTLFCFLNSNPHRERNRVTDEYMWTCQFPKVDIQLYLNKKPIDDAQFTCDIMWCSHDCMSRMPPASENLWQCGIHVWSGTFNMTFIVSHMWECLTTCEKSLHLMYEKNNIEI